ncbi:FAD/NAD(P)-binding protein [Streptomyces sp. QH1-20]|uniref:FAD/NAD(P)-binding protein n=1 Tax=Streptomyces sp. QH1-20 TaxID=3240934 RepID=UPI003515203A
MRSSRVEICVVGAGPRGLCVLERLCANERAAPSHSAVTVHVVDPAAPGAGAVWRTDQSRHLLMNTVASQITVYTDDSTRISGPVEPGPSLYAWARGLLAVGRTDGHDDETSALVGRTDDHDDETLAEARDLGPDSYPTRAFYGRYLRDSFRRVVARAPGHVTVVVHRSRAVALADTEGAPGGPQGVRLEDGTRLSGLDAVVMALGHVPARLAPREARTAALARSHRLRYVAPANPADVDPVGAGAGEPVLLRGLGLNFFDHMALFTAGRGGTFTRQGRRLVYRPSGDEPRLYAFSRRGVPYHARGRNEKGATGRHVPGLLTAEHIAGLRERARRGSPVRFGRDLWPLIAREVESVYYGTLLATSGRADERETFVDRYLALPPAADPAALLKSFGIADGDRWDWERLSRPYGDRTFACRAEFRHWLLGHLAEDVAAARAGNVGGPLKAALDVLRDLRNEIRLAVDHGGLDGDSHRDDLDGWYTPLNAFLSIGPPASRIEEMIALIEAGILEVTGPGTRVRIDPAGPGGPAFVAESDVVPGAPIRSGVLIEARLPEPDLRRTADPLLRHLADTGQITTFRVDAATGAGYETGGMAVTERPYRVIDGRGHAHPRRFAYGVPTESVHWVTAAGIRPGVDSVTLGDSDAIARAVLALPPVAHGYAAHAPGTRAASAPRHAAAGTDLTGATV